MNEKNDRIKLPADQAWRLFRTAERMLNVRFPGRALRDEDEKYAADTVELEGWTVHPLRLPEAKLEPGGDMRASLCIERADGAVFTTPWFWSGWKGEWMTLEIEDTVSFFRKDEAG